MIVCHRSNSNLMVTINVFNGDFNDGFVTWFMIWRKKRLVICDPNDQVPLPCLLTYPRRRKKWNSSYVQAEVYCDFSHKISILSHIPWPVGWPIFLSANGPTSMKTAICRWLRFIHFVLQVSIHDSCSKLEWGEKKK